MILPIHLLDTGDEHEFGKEYVLLSKLNRLGFPVASGFVISPPVREIMNYLTEQNVLTLTDFETKQEYLYQYLLDLQPSLHNINPAEGTHFQSSLPKLVKKWIHEVYSHFLRFGHFEASHFHLKSLPILFSSAPKASGVASFDPITHQIHIQVTGGELDHELVELVDDLIQKVNKKIGLKYNFHFIVGDQGIKLTRIGEAHHQIVTHNPAFLVKQTLEKTKLKRSIKLWTTFPGNFVLDENVNSYYLESAHFRSHDEKVMALTESLLAKKNEDVLYQISDQFLKSDTAAIKFCRNLKKLDNLDIVFSADCGSEALLKLKRDVAAEGVTRKGKMKFWVRVALPVSLLRTEEIIAAGFDGIVIDVDFLAAALHAHDITQLGLEEDVPGLFSFLEVQMKQLNKLKIPVIFYGNLNTHEEVMEKAIKWGVVGLVVKNNTEEIDQKVALKEQVLQFSLN